MQKNIFTIFPIQLLIAAGYLFYTNYLFVTEKEYNPIGTGIMQLFCIIVHFILTAIVFGVLIIIGKDRKLIKRSMIIGLLSVVLISVLYLLISGPIETYCDNLRDSYHKK